MKTLTDPCALDFKDAIIEVGGGIITEEWMETAWEAARTWVKGQLETSPYGTGTHPTPLVVTWQWAKSSLTVTIQRTR